MVDQGTTAPVIVADNALLFLARDDSARVRLAERRPMTTLVTGATGLLGGHLIDLLVERGERPRALVRPGENADRLAGAGVDVHFGDLSDSTALETAVKDVACVLHCAARTGPWGPVDEYERTNVYGLEALVRAAQAAGVRRVVHVSSITVHGNDVRGTAHEGSPLCGASNPYSRSKVTGERLLQRMIEDNAAPVTIVRPGWIYGPRDVASFARFAKLIQEGRMVMFGSGENRLPLIYVRDVAEGALQAAAAIDAVGRAYILVNDERVTQRDYLRAIASELGVPPPKRRIPYRLGLTVGAGVEMAARLARRSQPPPVMRYGIQLLGGDNRFTIERARRELGFSPRVGFTEGVKQSVDWYRGAYVPQYV